MESENQNILIGTSGYDYLQWKGIFYPEDLKRDDFLNYYSKIFNTVELNFTFYQIPTKEKIQSFIDRSEGRLQFSIKVNKMLTHEKRGDWKKIADDFKESLEPLINTNLLCAVLFQLPPYFSYTKENRIYLAELLGQFKGLPCVVEFRNPEWIKESVFKGLEERNVSVAFADVPNHFIGNIGYMRLHNHEVIDETKLQKMKTLANTATTEGKKVMIYFANYADDTGIGNAVRVQKRFNNN